MFTESRILLPILDRVVIRSMKQHSSTSAASLDSRTGRESHIWAGGCLSHWSAELREPSSNFEPWANAHAAWIHVKQRRASNLENIKKYHCIIVANVESGKLVCYSRSRHMSRLCSLVLLLQLVCVMAVPANNWLIWPRLLIIALKPK